MPQPVGLPCSHRLRRSPRIVAPGAPSPPCTPLAPPCPIKCGLATGKTGCLHHRQGDGVAGGGSVRGGGACATPVQADRLLSCIAHPPAPLPVEHVARVTGCRGSPACGGGDCASRSPLPRRASPLAPPLRRCCRGLPDVGFLLVRWRPRCAARPRPPLLCCFLLLPPRLGRPAGPCLLRGLRTGTPGASGWVLFTRCAARPRAADVLANYPCGGETRQPRKGVDRIPLHRGTAGKTSAATYTQLARNLRYT